MARTSSPARRSAPSPAFQTPPAPTHVNVVVADRLFDHAYYAAASGISGTRAELATHYLAVGEPARLSPSRAFDVPFYLATNPDVRDSGNSPLVHYLNYGRAEHRYATPHALRRDAALVEASGLFDAPAYAWSRTHQPLPGLSDIEDYLSVRNHLAPIGDSFDSAFYLRAYEDARGAGAPILHYLRVGLSQNRLCTGHELHKRAEAARPRFNERHYFAQLRNRFPDQSMPDDPMQHYMLIGSRLGLDPAPDFSADYYLRVYPDIRRSGMDPFFHFTAHGFDEGRIGRPDFTASIRRGAVAFDLAKPTVLVASHEASRTGAPLVGLNVGARLAKTHNVITYLGKHGPLESSFADHSCTMVVAPISTLDAEYLLQQLKTSHHLSAVLLNSVETSPLAHAALHADLPSVALIHEFADYTLPVGRMSDVVEAVDRAITPATIVQDSLQAELTATRGGQANNTMVRPQGYLPTLPEDGAENDLTRDEILAFVEATDNVRIVLGAGYVQMRKGVDLFVQTAAEVRRLHGDDVRFIWVGAGYMPQADLQYSAWVADMVRRLDLERHVMFLPSQSSLDALFALSDVFYLPSRLDPFPNVVLDAFKAGRAVVCFDRATGVAAALRDEADQPGAVGEAVPYCDVTAAAAALVRSFAPDQAKRAHGNTEFADRRFDFGAYVAAIDQQFALAASLQTEASRATDAIIGSGLFDAAFHDSAPTAPDPRALRASVRAYVARGQKGLVRYNPRPGFNEGAARARLSQPGPALLADGATPTHRCVVLPDATATGPHSTGPHSSGPHSTAFDANATPSRPMRAALHLHLHYPELAAEFASLLTAALAERDGGEPGRLDLVLTSTSNARKLEIEYAFRRYKAGSVQVLVAANRGRDIGPFVAEAGRVLRFGDYDIVGHLHGKRSLAVDGAMGDRWRTYLVSTLLGGEAGIAAVLSLFAQDTNLGLLFAEDRHCVGWGKNRPFAAALAARMDPVPTLPDWPIFPIGTMFWARPAAMQPLWSLGLETHDFPAEPAPYDGSVLHAIERMLPAVCEATGHNWCTLYRAGTGW